MLPYSSMLCLVHDLSADVELGTVWVKIQPLDTDLEHEVDSLRDCCAAVLGGGDFADCAGSEEIIWAD